MTQVCNYLDSCKTRYLWAKVRDAVAHTLDSITLAELVAVAAQGQNAATQFISLSDVHVGLGSSNPRELCLPSKDGESEVRPFSS